MSVLSEKSEGERLLSGLEAGTLSGNDAFMIAEKLDPVLFYFIVRYLREKNPPSDPNSAAMMERLVELTSTYPELVKRAKEAEKDPMREWFDDTHNMREFFGDPQGFLDLIVDKLES